MPFCFLAVARLHSRDMSLSPNDLIARRLACVAACICALWVVQVGAVTLAERARESGCTTKPTSMSGALYKCRTGSGAEAFFNVPDARSQAAPATAKRTPTPANFPRVDSDTQKSRDDMRHKVLGDELSTEEKLLAETRAEYGNGAPAPLPEEKADAERYRQRIERLRQSLQLHERNVEALKKELGQ